MKVSSEYAHTKAGRFVEIGMKAGKQTSRDEGRSVGGDEGNDLVNAYFL